MALVFVVWNCKGNGEEGADDKGKIVATVYDKTLYSSQVRAAMNTNVSQLDSAFSAKEFIHSWIKQQVLIHAAEEKLTDDEKDKSSELEQYLNDLLIYELQQKIVLQRLDTNISDIEVNKYYDDNQSNFELKENIVRLIFFKLPATLPKTDKLWAKFQKGGQEDLEEITYTAVESGGNFFRDEDIWLSFDDILKEIPINTYNQENFLNNNQLIRINDKNFIYFVKILDFKIKNSISPLEFEREKIRNMILNKRRVSLINMYEEQLLKEAHQQEKVKLF
jgi:hypothetical protein